MSIAEMLQRSRAAHQAYYGQVRAWNATTRTWSAAADLEPAKACLREAATLRQQAHDADPEHRDAEWRNDAGPHEELLRFYEVHGA